MRNLLYLAAYVQMDQVKESADADQKVGNSENLDSDVQVKKEVNTDTIKNYAESTMNELLGLFGYEDKINSTDTENLNLDNYTDTRDGQEVTKDDNSKDDKNKSAARLKSRLRKRLAISDAQSLVNQHMNLVTALISQERAESDERSSSASSESDALLRCAWCKKPGNKQFCLETPTGSKVFCSEVCFTQCRRASFKKSKICDWCKHVRHTVNYVEFQDGETQLQFCSEKCLNQYKMSIFCKETQEHLKKMAEKGDEVSDDKDNEKEILITPDLWLSGESSRRAAEARESARERARIEKRESREHFRKTLLSSCEKLAKKSPDSSEQTRHTLVDRMKNDSTMKHRRSVIARDRDTERASPGRPEVPTSSSHPTMMSALPPHFMHPALAGMAPWIHQAQMMGAMSQTQPPMAGMPPLLLHGFPPYPGNMAPAGLVSPSSQPDRGEKSDKRFVKKEPGSTHDLLSPTSGRSSMSESPVQTETHAHTRPGSSPSLADRRTSSLFPVDFPNMFQNGAFPGLVPNFPPGMSHLRPPMPMTPNGVPPVTVMVPFPVLMPIPVPVPIPIPLTLETLKNHFNATNNSKTRSPETKPSTSSPEKIRLPVSPRPLSLHSPQSVTSGSEYDRTENVRSGSRNSLPDLALTYGRSDSRRVEPFSYKRSRTPEEAMSLDLSRSAAKVPRYSFVSYNSNSNDGVIDLSASRGNGHRSDEAGSENESISQSGDLDKSVSRDDNDNVTDEVDSVPKIHIITHTDEEVPLNQPLPLPPTEHPYSTRRGLILDAPTVPKKSKSPSPERRIYVRNVPRDIIEAARRRCLRTRIRTK